MNRTAAASLPLILVIAFSCISILVKAQEQTGAVAPAEPTAKVDSANYYFDAIGGATWRRCDVGKRAAPGMRCSGKSITATWPEAILLVLELNAQKFEGADDWRLPSRRDLRNLIMNVPGLREPIGTNYYLYGFGPADFNAVYEDGTKVNFGGRFPGRGSNQCEVAADFMAKTLGQNLGIAPDYGSIEARINPENHRWLSNNESWDNGVRVPSSANSFQNPISINFSSKCDYILAAFFRSDKTFNLMSTLRPHAALPLLIVRGGSPDRSWQDAQGSVSREADILARSRQDAAAQMAAVLGIVNRVQGYMRDLMSHGGGAPAAGSSPPSNAGDAAPNPSAAGPSSFICQYVCSDKAALSYADKVRLSVKISASSLRSAEDLAAQHAHQNCFAQTRRVFDAGSASCRKN